MYMKKHATVSQIATQPEVFTKVVATQPEVFTKVVATQQRSQVQGITGG